MLYRLLRPAATIALRLYYRQIEAVGLERIPAHGATLLAVNHPNALVDALVVGTFVPRRVHMTAKATLFANPVANRFLRAVGVIPLRRAKDEQAGAPADPRRNADAFRAVMETLRAGHALMIFPEGISHDEPALAPLRTGAARMALQARDEHRVRGMMVVPVGLVFSRKEAPRSRVLMEVGDPIAMDEWVPTDSARAVEELTADIESRLRAVTLNFASLDDATQATSLARLLARIVSDRTPSLDEAGPRLAEAAAITRRLEQVRRLLPMLDGATRDRIAHFVRDVEAFETELQSRALRADDLRIEDDVSSGAWFVAREAWILLVAGPFALWGNVNHWLPIRIARIVALRGVSSAADPAMRTIVAGAALLLLSYAIQGVIVAQLFGATAAAVYVLSLPLAAEINYRMRERWRRAVRRARTFLLFRREPAVRDALRERATALRREALALDATLSAR